MEKVWNILPEPPAEFYSTHPELPAVAARLLFHRNISTQQRIDEFLNPDYSQDVHDPFLFQDMQDTVERIFFAIEKNERIVIHGDYDADGVSAATILSSTFKVLGATQLDVFLPHRDIDGYGLNMNTIDLLHNQGTNLIITCDCGVSNVQEITKANEYGMDVIVTDHHAVPDTLPPAYSIIHPKVPGEPYPDKELCGGGVAFKLVQALLKHHQKDHETLPNGERHESWEKWLLDMVAIASVADMVPLLGETRTLTKYGLIVLNKTRRLGLQKLLHEAKLLHDDGTTKRELDATTIGFRIAPRINAAGRLDHANVAYKLMITDDPIEATDLAFQLDKNNKDRQEITESCVKEAIAQIEKDQKDSPVLFVLHKDWQTGLVGLIASRIKELYYKPTIAMAYGHGSIMGSGRSIEGFNMIEAMQQIPEYFTKFGGHPMACGFTLITEESLQEFQKKFISLYKEKTAAMDMSKQLMIDADVTLEDVNWQLYDILEKFKPFGKQNEEPLFVAKSVTVAQCKPVGKGGKHLQLFVQHKTPRLRKLVGWHLCNGEKGKKNWGNSLETGDKIDVVFTLGVNEWNGNRELQMTIVDLKKV